ncbi:flavin reductase family protein [Sphingomonas sp.]|uniref:flavin reductase family protein n=1 Tax=Sphingomonas sp. TaxID=28214 RepID=UPI003B3A62AD
MRAMPKSDRYKILGSCVTPRPIAWITSLSDHGIVNAAPYSFFNMMGDDPLTIAVGLMAHDKGRLKDTAANIVASGEFVVNLVDVAHGETMNLTCIDAPPEVSEAELAGLTMAPSVMVKPPRIATAPASFECRSLHEIATGQNQVVIIAEVLYGHLVDAFITDAERLYVDAPAMNLLGRMHGSGWYSLQTDLFQITRPKWKETHESAAGR